MSDDEFDEWFEYHKEQNPHIYTNHPQTHQQYHDDDANDDRYDENVDHTDVENNDRAIYADDIDGDNGRKNDSSTHIYPYPYHTVSYLSDRICKK